MGRDQLIEDLREKLGGRSDVRLALLFGSWARGQQGPESDIDIAVSGQADRLALAAELSAATGREVQVQSLDADLGVPLLEEVVRDAVVVAQAHPGAAASWRTRALITLETDRPWYARMRDAYLRRITDRGL